MRSFLQNLQRRLQSARATPFADSLDVNFPGEVLSRRPCNKLGDIVMSASVSSHTTTESYYASDYLYLQMQSSRVRPHSHISLPSLAVKSFALYAAELTSLRIAH